MSLNWLWILIGIIGIVLALWGKFYYPNTTFKEKQLNKNEKWLLLSYKRLDEYELHLEVISFTFIIAAFTIPQRSIALFLFVFGFSLFIMAFVTHCRAEKRYTQLSKMYKRQK